MPSQTLAIALCRVSSTEQLENNSLNRQRNAIIAAADKEQFLRFAMDFVQNMSTNFFEVSQESRLRCKQLVFPGGFYMDAQNKVYTPEISPLYSLQTKKKDAEASINSHLVQHS